MVHLVPMKAASLACLIVSAHLAHGQSLPTLPDRFSAIIEANIMQKNQTWIMEEFYDYAQQKAKRVFFVNDLIQTSYEDFSDAQDALWSYTTTHDDADTLLSCTLDSYKANADGFSVFDESSSGRLISSAEWFLFGSNFSETYIGKSTVRGIASEGWTRNVTLGPVDFDGHTASFNFELTYYFSVESWNWFLSSQHRVPVRVDMQGTRTLDYGNGTTVDYAYHHFYDYVQFFADDLTLEDELEFAVPEFVAQCNVTKYCAVYPTESVCSLFKGPELPKISESFSARYEMATQSTQSTSVGEIYYDYVNQHVHYVFRYGPTFEDSVHQLVRLSDGGEGQSWVWQQDGDSDAENCYMAGRTSNFTGRDFSTPIVDGQIVNPNAFLMFDDQVDGLSDEVWLGYTTRRNIAVEKWKATYSIVVDGDEYNALDPTVWLSLQAHDRLVNNGTAYWYFTTSNWTLAYDPNESVVPVAAEFEGTYKLYNKSDEGEYTLIEENSFANSYEMMGYVEGTPDDAFFAPPTYWRRDCAIDAAYCAALQDESAAEEEVCDEGLDLPSLPEHKYYAVLEGNDMELQQTHALKVWYNYDTNEYRNEYYNNATVVVTYDDLDADRRWTWVHPINDTDSILSCNVQSYQSTISVDTEDYAEEYVGAGHIKTAQQLWRFSAEYEPTYLGDGVSARNIPARAWQTSTAASGNDPDDGTPYTWQFDSVFYFADSDWDYYSAIEASDVPLKVDYVGSYTNNVTGETTLFNTEYQVVSFFSGAEAFDESEMEFVFAEWYSECDVSAYCATYPADDLCSEARGPDMPTLPEQFFAIIEASSVSTNADGEEMFSGTWVIEEWYDYTGNEAHVVVHDGPDWRGDAQHQLDRLDVDQKWLWTGYGDDEDSDGDELSGCTLTQPIADFSGVDVYIAETNGHIASPSRWFRWDESGEDSTTTADLFVGYDTVRGIPAAKWTSEWSEYDEVPAAPFQAAYALQMDVSATYYWSDEDWILQTSIGWTGGVPLRLELEGTYTLYNESVAGSGDFDVLWTANTFTSSYEIVAFNPGAQDADYFAVPALYAQCDMTLYCAVYPDNFPCDEDADTDIDIDSDSDEDDDADGSTESGDAEDGLGAGYIVLMIVLFLIGLFVGAAIDRYIVRKKGTAHFVETQTKPQDAGL